MLASSLVPGTSYAVRIETQPAGEACAVAGGVGTIQSAHVTDVLVTCSDLSFAVGGTISGLTSSGLVLANGSNTLAVMPGASSFTMPTPVVYGDAYAVTVQTQPSGLACSVSNGTGTMGAAGVTSVSIVCVPNFTLLYSFAGGSSDGSDPYHCLIEATDGDFYGTTLAGGAHSGGTIFEITQSGAESVFFSFASMPFACLTQGSDGNFYGTTASGGSSGRGTVFEITPSGTETTLYSFPAGASQPYTGLIQGSDGNFYGTTGANGTSDDGTVFEITSSGVKTVLHAFPKGTSSDGQIPYAGLVEGSDGNFYGTTYFGGSSDLGTVFMVTPSGAETVLYSFTGGSDGASPYAGLIEGRDGNLYGTTYAGGTSGLGTAFKITPSGTETVLYSFAGGSTDGANPEAGLTEGPDGNFYGTTFLGGASNLGTVFKLTPGGTETVLHAFAGGASDGAKPTANLVQGSDDNLYGSTNAGGPSGNGTFFKVTLP
ncbi:MAG TPA: choice-of-anchor tandem repeat GloVer-containing protein [Steroidobacteraceae bacterium]|nr:choice-of-anchor tandem repeat GloVer-containing protein [Steroidobacteraceae bacterium]